MKKVIIVGAGKKGIEMLNILGTEYVECFADNSKEKQESGVAGKRVIPINELRYIHQDYVLVVSPIKYHSILEQLHEIGCDEYIVISNPIVSHISKEETITTLYTPTMIKKCGEYYFIIDCWHHRILYSSDLNLPVYRWKILDDKLQNPHSIDAIGRYYVVDNSDANEIVLYIDKGNEFVRASRLHIQGRPHKVVHSKLWNAYLVLMSESTSIAMVNVENEELHLLRIIEWDIPKGYSGSIKIVEDRLFIVSSYGIIYCIDEKDIFTNDLVKYNMHSSLYGMSDIGYWNNFWFVSNYTDKNGNRNPIIAYSKSLEGLCRGDYKTVQIESSGIPYFFEIIDEKLFITNIDMASNIAVIKQNQSDFNLELMYSNKEISAYDLYKRFSVERIQNYENIGKVCIKYDYYGGQDKYSDGPIEDEILEACMNNRIEELFERSNRWEVFYHFCNLRKNLLDWIEIDKSAEVLEIGAGMGAITAVLSEKFKHVDCIELSQKRSLINAYRNKNCDNVTIYVGNYQDIEPVLPQYDCITLIGVLEYSALYLDSEKPFIRMLELARNHLKDDGKLIIAIENKIGLKYLNGYTEDHVGIPYAGINEYVDAKEIKTFSRVELEELLKTAGFISTDFYYPFPDYKLPTEIYSDRYLPLIGDLRNMDEWSRDQRMNFNMITMWDSICKEKIFPSFSNSFLVFAKMNADDGKIIYEKTNYRRKHEYAVNTLIESHGDELCVIKSPMYKEAKVHVSNIINNEKKWNSSNPSIPCKTGKLINGNYVCEYIVGIRLDNFLYQHRYDSSKFFDLLKGIIDNYYFSNRATIPFQETKEFTDMFGTYGVLGDLSYEVTNIDLVFHNIFIADNNDLFCTDCEWIVDFPVPYKFVAWRAINQLYYFFYDVYRNTINLKSLYEELGISEKKQNAFMRMERKFHNYVINQELDNVLSKYKKKINEFKF